MQYSAKALTSKVVTELDGLWHVVVGKPSYGHSTETMYLALEVFLRSRSPEELAALKEIRETGRSESTHFTEISLLSSVLQGMLTITMLL